MVPGSYLMVPGGYLMVPVNNISISAAIIIFVHVSFVFSMVKNILPLDGAGGTLNRKTKCIHSLFMTHVKVNSHYQLLLYTFVCFLAQKKIMS